MANHGQINVTDIFTIVSAPRDVAHSKKTSVHAGALRRGFLKRWRAGS